MGGGNHRPYRALCNLAILDVEPPNRLRAAEKRRSSLSRLVLLAGSNQDKAKFWPAAGPIVTANQVRSPLTSTDGSGLPLRPPGDLVVFLSPAVAARRLRFIRGRRWERGKEHMAARVCRGAAGKMTWSCQRGRRFPGGRRRKNTAEELHFYSTMGQRFAAAKPQHAILAPAAQGGSRWAGPLVPSTHPAPRWE